MRPLRFPRTRQNVVADELTFVIQSLHPALVSGRRKDAEPNLFAIADCRLAVEMQPAGTGRIHDADRGEFNAGRDFVVFADVADVIVRSPIWPKQFFLPFGCDDMGKNDSLAGPRHSKRFLEELLARVKIKRRFDAGDVVE